MNETVLNTFLPAMLVIGAALRVLSNTELIRTENNLDSIGGFLMFLFDRPRPIHETVNSIQMTISS